jgi:hypothetical protein
MAIRDRSQSPATPGSIRPAPYANTCSRQELKPGTAFLDRTHADENNVIVRRFPELGE